MMIILCCSSLSWLVIRISEVVNVKIQCVCLLRPFLCRWFSLEAMSAHFKGQTSHEAHTPHFDDYVVLWLTIFVGDPNFEVENVKI